MLPPDRLPPFSAVSAVSVITAVAVVGLALAGGVGCRGAASEPSPAVSQDRRRAVEPDGAVASAMTAPPASEAGAAAPSPVPMTEPTAGFDRSAIRRSPPVPPPKNPPLRRTSAMLDSPSARLAGKFPNFTLTTHDGARVAFYEDLIRDRVVVVNFMYTTCTGI